MAAKAEKLVPEVAPEKPLTFICKFCGETRPISDLVVIRHFFPQLAACKECARSKKIIETEPAPAEESAE